jgi:putative ABC transport system permease protein
MNLAYRDIRHNLGRFLLTCLGVGLLLGIVLSMIGIYRGLVDDALVLVRAPQVQLWVVEAGRRGPFAESSRLPEDTRDIIARLEGVAAAGPVTYQSVEARLGERKLRLNVVGHEPGLPGGPPPLVAGRPITRGHYELVADRRAGIAPGTAIRLGRNVFTVVGLTQGQVDSAGNPVVYMTLADAQRLQFQLEGDAARAQAARGVAQNPPTANAIVARLAPGASADAVAATVRRWKHLSALTQAEQEAMLLESVVEKARRQIGLFTATLLIVSTVIIALIVYTLTLDKTREIATLKLIGAPDRTIVGLILQQALAIGTIGFFAGAALLVNLTDIFPRRVLLMPQDALALGGATLVVCVVASALGVRLALRIDPSRALGG